MIAIFSAYIYISKMQLSVYFSFSTNKTLVNMLIRNKDDTILNIIYAITRAIVRYDNEWLMCILNKKGPIRPVKLNKSFKFYQNLFRH